MKRWTRWIGLGAALGIILALVPVVQGSVQLDDPLRRVSTWKDKRLGSVDLEGLDLTRLDVRPRRVTTRLSNGRTAELTLDANAQRVAMGQLRQYRVPEGGLILMKVSTGEILAYASYVAEGKPFDVNLRADAPAASIFKVITGSALVEKANLTSETEQCYHGGKSRIEASELVDDPVRDKWCATLGIALGRSLNVVFGKLAKKHLTPDDLAGMAGAYGFGRSVPFVLENEPLRLEIPDDPVEFSRTAAGFWHTTLSPLAAVLIAQTVANKGVTLQPRIIRSISKGRRKLWQDPGKPVVLRRAIQRSTAEQVTKMMLQTVANGSAYKSFHDSRGRPYVPGVSVAGKTGTLTWHERNRHYTWFVGFAPADKPEVAIASLVVNTPMWRIRGPQLAAAVLRAYFAKEGARVAKE